MFRCVYVCLYGTWYKMVIWFNYSGELLTRLFGRVIVWFAERERERQRLQQACNSPVLQRAVCTGQADRRQTLEQESESRGKKLLLQRRRQVESRAASEVAQRVPMSARRSGNPSKLFRLSSLVHPHPHPLFKSGFRGPPCTLTFAWHHAPCTRA